ncbi:MAG: hypothetical protein AAGE03_01605 [Pseudomonadota bacterium]
MTDSPAWTDPDRPQVAPALPYADHWFWQAGMGPVEGPPTVRSFQTARLVANLAEEIAKIEDDIDKIFGQLLSMEGAKK